MPTLAKSFRTRPAGLLGSRPFDRSSMTASSGAALRLLALAIVLAALYALGALFVFVTLFLPRGLAGLGRQRRLFENDPGISFVPGRTSACRSEAN